MSTSLQQTGTLQGTVTVGKMIVNDYIFTITEQENGYLFTAKRGSEIQTMEIPYSEGGSSGGGGTAGKDGGYYTPSVDDGWLSWTPSQSGMPDVPKVYIQGAPGKDGKDGADGTDGKTPVKGEDYFTEEEIDEIAGKAAEKVTVSIDEVLPSQVIFPDGAQTAFQIGTVTLNNGIGELIPKGGTLEDFFDKFMKVMTPTTTQPKVSLTFSQAKAYEAGTKVTPTYSASLSAGSYTYGPATGVAATGWTVTDTAGHSASTPSGSFAEVEATDGISYKITATATHGAGAVPVCNNGDAYPAGQIAAGSKSATSGAITAYRNTFYGTTADKATVTADTVRSLAGKSGKTLTNGATFNVDVPVGAMRVLVCYPATLRDMTSAKDVNGMNAESVSGFSKTTLNVPGANGYSPISYKVFAMEFANANDKANKFAITI